MAGLGNIVQKAFYLGVGLASVASEKAGGTLSELRVQAQKLADELVERGQMTTEEAKKLVDDMVQQAQQEPPVKPSNDTPASEPRRIEILSEDETPSSAATEAQNNVDTLRKQVQAMQDELRRLKRE